MRGQRAAERDDYGDISSDVHTDGRDVRQRLRHGDNHSARARLRHDVLRDRYERTTVILTPMPAAGSAAFWSAGGLCSRTGACNVTVTANATVTVTFEPIGTFTDAVLTPLGTAVKAVHFLELRADIDALRQNHGLSPFAWTDPALIPGVAIARSVHLIELRSAVSQVYVRAGRVAPMFTESGIASGVTVIKTIHINELRSAVIGLR